MVLNFSTFKPIIINSEKGKKEKRLLSKNLLHSKISSKTNILYNDFIKDSSASSRWPF